MSETTNELPATMEEGLWHSIIPCDLDRLLSAAPLNKSFRTMLEVKIKQRIPEEVQGYKAMMEWVNSNIKGLPTPPNRHPVVRNDDTALVLEREYESMEFGQAKYSVRATRTDTLRYTTTQLRQIMEDADDWNNLLCLLEEGVDSCRGYQDGSTYYGDYDYVDHDCDDSEQENDEWVLGGDRLETAIAQAVRLIISVMDEDEQQEMLAKLDMEL